jgi:hypothetical protein
MSDEPTTDKMDRKGWAAFIAGALFAFAAILLAAFIFWAYRMVTVGGSVTVVWQMAISLGWSAVAFATMTLVGSVLCVFLALNCLASRD